MNPTQRILSHPPAPATSVPAGALERKTQPENDLRNQPDAGKAAEISPACDKMRQNSAENPGTGSDATTGATSSPPRRGRPRKGMERLIWELAIGSTLKTAAKRAGVSRRTAERRWKEADFVLEIFAVRRQFRNSASGRMSVLTKDAVDILETALTTDIPASRISAARAILRFAESWGTKGEELALMRQSLAEAVDKVGIPFGAPEPESESY